MRSHACEIWLDVRGLGLAPDVSGRIERWLVKEGDHVAPGTSVAVVTLGGKSFEFKITYRGVVDLIQTGAGERIHAGIGMLQVVSSERPPDLPARLVAFDAHAA